MAFDYRDYRLNRIKALCVCDLNIFNVRLVLLPIGSTRRFIILIMSNPLFIACNCHILKLKVFKLG